MTEIGGRPQFFCGIQDIEWVVSWQDQMREDAAVKPKGRLPDSGRFGRFKYRPANQASKIGSKASCLGCRHLTQVKACSPAKREIIKGAAERAEKLHGLETARDAAGRDRDGRGNGTRDERGRWDAACRRKLKTDRRHGKRR